MVILLVGRAMRVRMPHGELKWEIPAKLRIEGKSSQTERAYPRLTGSTRLNIPRELV